MFKKSNCLIINRGEKCAEGYPEFQHNASTASIMVDEESNVLFALPGSGTITPEIMYSVLEIINRYYENGKDQGEYLKAHEIRRALLIS